MSLEAESNSGLHHMTLDDVVVEKLMSVASNLVQLGVGLVGCQKCVHPQLKDYLRAKVSGREGHSQLPCPASYHNIYGLSLLNSAYSDTIHVVCRGRS